MTKTASVDVENFDRFMRAMARTLGVSRKRLDKIMFQGRYSSEQRRNTPPSNDAVRVRKTK